jgi:hypothetical protein
MGMGATAGVMAKKAMNKAPAATAVTGAALEPAPTGNPPSPALMAKVAPVTTKMKSRKAASVTTGAGSGGYIG